MSKLILDDIDLENICGIDCKYEDDYILIEQEIDKLNSIYSDPIDWELVNANSITILENKSKDYKLATWWIYSIWKLYSWNGLNDNLSLYNDFINKYSNQLFPSSLKSKINNLYWLEELLTKEILSNNDNTAAHIYASLYIEFKQLSETIQTHINDEKRFFRKIIDLLEPYYQEEQNTKDSEQIQIQEKAIPTDEFNFNSQSSLDISGANKMVSEIKKALSSITKYYREQNIINLQTIRMVRFIAWLEIDELPYTQSGHTTLMYPPLELEIDEIHSLIAEEKYIEAINLTEEIIEVVPFWLEGHYITYDLLTKINKEQEALEVKNQLLNFIELFNGIEKYSFNDNSSFLSKKVHTWVQTLQTDNSSSASSQKSGKSEFDSQLEHINELTQSKKILDAMQLVETYYNSSSTAEEKFIWRLNHAELAIEFNKKNVALALLLDLKEDINKFQLDKWNPKLASKVYALILNTYTNIDIEQEILEKIYNDLCKINISDAFEIKI